MIRLAEKSSKTKGSASVLVPEVREEQKIFERQANKLTQSVENMKLTGLQEEMCKEHGRKQELICIQDKTRICYNCALFG